MVSVRKDGREIGNNDRSRVDLQNRARARYPGPPTPKSHPLTDDNKRLRLQRCRQPCNSTQLEIEKIAFTDECLFTVE